MSKKAKKKPVAKAAKSKKSTAPKKPLRKASKKAPTKRKLAAKGAPGGISSAAVEKATGKGWDEWVRLLDADGAKSLPHKEIAEIVHGKYGVGDWWSQMVTVGYEQAKGLRKPHETARGFQASASKTINASIADLFDHWSHDLLRAQWFEPVMLNIRKETRDKSMRVSWPDGTSVEINFYSKGPRKSQVALQHSKLKSARDVAKIKKFWGAALEDLKKLLG